MGIKQEDRAEDECKRNKNIQMDDQERRNKK